jgi:hypothetical protein
METDKLTNFTTLSWEKPKTENGNIGYYVLMRETDVSTWQKKFFTKDTVMRLPYSRIIISLQYRQSMHQEMKALW